MRHLPRLLVLLVLAACGDSSPPPADTSDATDTADTPDTADTADTSDLGDASPWQCLLSPDADPLETPFLERLGCATDFEALASEPLDASIPGARSLKTVVDRVDGNHLYFQSSKLYGIHHAFCSAHLSGSGLPPVPPLSQFNQTEYYSPARRFLLGAVTYYEGPDVWAYELSPYDTSSATFIETAFDLIRAQTYFGDRLRFHPTSAAIEAVAATLPADIPLITTDELFAGIDYQPLNLATGTGRLRFVNAADLDQTSLDFRDIVVLDRVPNDISVVAGIITDQLQTPLAHINVLSQNRGTPNMALVGAFSNDTLRALDGQFVELTVGAFTWSIRQITQAEADAWWEAHRPEPLGLPGRDLSTTAIVDITDVTRAPTPEEGKDLGPALDEAIPAYGGKASHYSALTLIDGLRVPEALAIPIYWYVKHLTDHGFDTRITAMLADPTFKGDATARATMLAQLRDDIIAAPIDPDFLAEVLYRLESLPSQRVRFRSSTNAEDLEGFTGAGLYTSVTGDPYDPDDPVDLAIKTVWASVWRQKAFDEREYRGIDHAAVGMALLVSPAFSAEEANGVAITANLFDVSGGEPGFVINVQRGDTSVVLPPAGILSDYFIYYYDYPGQPMVFLTHSNMIPAGTHVLTSDQARELGAGLTKIHAHFAATYARSGHFYGMDVEFKFDAAVGQTPVLWVKQARPHPGWGLTP